MNTEQLKAQGFTGFLKIAALKQNASPIPKVPGVYVVLRPGLEPVEFLTVGIGGFFKDRNPNVSLRDLQQKWIDQSQVIYIGKAGGANSSATLHSRLRQYLQFGMGKKVGHWGGRYIWQIKNIDNCLIAWKELRSEDPRTVESELLNRFQNQYGKLPFANLTY